MSSFDSRMVFRPPTGGPATKGLCGALVIVSVVAAIFQRYTNITVPLLSYDVTRIFNKEFWRLVTYPFYEPEPMRLIFSGLMLWFFGGWFEAMYGTRGLLRFFAVGTLGSALLAIPLFFAVNLLLPFNDPGASFGPDPIVNAILVAMAMSSPNSNVLFGFILPMKTRTVVYVVIGLQVLSGLMTGVAGLSMTLAGIAMGAILVTGVWRPRRLLDKLYLWQLTRRRRKHGLYVVPPKDKTLH